MCQTEPKLKFLCYTQISELRKGVEFSENTIGRLCRAVDELRAIAAKYANESMMDSGDTLYMTKECGRPVLVTSEEIIKFIIIIRKLSS
ncbi:MAG: hypothetical protein LBF94_01440 [Puniceicoccales bacterium]|nr:hypothetical protein [Puniceicoccales bacterium]